MKKHDIDIVGLARAMKDCAKHDYEKRFYQKVIWTGKIPDEIGPKFEKETMFQKTMRMYENSVRQRFLDILEYNSK